MSYPKAKSTSYARALLSNKLDFNYWYTRIVIMRRQWFILMGLIALLFALRLMIFGHQELIPMFILLIIAVWIRDVTQKKSAIRRNFPVVGNFRHLFEFIRPEIQQYFIANDEEEKPFNREIRSVIYRRSKNVRDTIPFGTSKDIWEVGYTWVLHSLSPKAVEDVESRILVGGPDCKQPYSASRLNVSAMSFGALSANAVKALNHGARIGNFAQNTGEGGLSSYHLQGGDIIFQVGTGYFGCRDEDGNFSDSLFTEIARRQEVKMIEIKLSQGAKPSHGGILPVVKLTEEIAKIRRVKLGEDVISPPAHTAFSTPKGLLEFVKRLRNLSSGKPVGFKLCVGKSSEFFAICKAMLETRILPDFITVDGAEGGTGAAPLEFSNRIGQPLDSALFLVHNTLVGLNLRDKIKVICSGKIATGFDMVYRIASGADLCNAARSMMISIGCVQSKQCDVNTCPTGVATQKARLQKGLDVDLKMHRAAAYHRNTIHSFLGIVGAMGLTNPSELKPSHLMHRISSEESKPLSEVLDYLKSGDLLGKEIPAKYKADWLAADADSF